MSDFINRSAELGYAKGTLILIICLAGVFAICTAEADVLRRRDRGLRLLLLNRQELADQPDHQQFEQIEEASGE